MPDETTRSRRSLLLTSAAVAAGLAGCNVDSGPSPTDAATDSPADSSTDAPTDQPTGTPTGTRPGEGTDTPSVTDELTDTPDETPSAEKPSLGEFTYPLGASRTGIGAVELHHNQLVTTGQEYGNFTYHSERVERTGDVEKTTIQSVRWAGDTGYFREVDNGDGSENENRWASVDEEAQRGDTSVTYVQAFTGDRDAYYIEEGQLDAETAIEGDRLYQVLRAADWSEAREVVPVGDRWGVTYEAVGVAEPHFVVGDSELQSLEASITVVAVDIAEPAGIVTDLDYTIERVTPRGETEVIEHTATVTDVDTTTVEEPDWYLVARHRGYYLRNPRLSETDRAVKVDVSSGPSLGTDAVVAVSTPNGHARSSPPTEVEPGDILFAGLTSDTELEVRVNEHPDDANEIQNWAHVTIKPAEGAPAILDETVQV